MHPKTVKLGGFSGHNQSRDFMRSVRPPVAARSLFSNVINSWFRPIWEETIGRFSLYWRFHFGAYYNNLI